MRKHLRPLVVCLVLITFAGCLKKESRLEDGRDYKEAYEQEVRKNRDLTSKYLGALTKDLERSDLTFEGHTLLSQLLNLTNEFDRTSEAFLRILKDERSKLRTNDRTGVSTSLARVKTALENVLSAIGQIETKLSDNVLKQLKKNADKDIIVDPETWKQTYENAAELAENLQGIRDAYLLLEEDFKHMVQIRVTELGGGPLPEAQPVVSTPRTRPNPIVTDATRGGRVVGFARDSQTGNPVPSAQVGFKWEQGNSPYFHQTSTDARGAYTSPYLLPGRYYVDIKKEGLAISRDAEIDVQVGQDRQSNFTLTEPIPDGKFRIVMSWCNDRVAGAVRDVDSYLEIPGARQPLHYTMQRQMYENTHLDIDDTTWEGPETTTIHVVRRGTYKFYVNNFNFRSSREALGNSQVHVEVYEGDRKIRDYRVPAGVGINYEVFHIVDGEIQDVKRFNDSLWVTGA